MLYWIIVGIIAGWLAGKLVRGEGFGLIGDLLLGLIGGLVGGWIRLTPSCATSRADLRTAFS